jgi:spore coat protein CotF
VIQPSNSGKNLPIQRQPTTPDVVQQMAQMQDLTDVVKLAIDELHNLVSYSEFRTMVSAETNAVTQAATNLTPELKTELQEQRKQLFQITHQIIELGGLGILLILKQSVREHHP